MQPHLPQVPAATSHGAVAMLGAMLCFSLNDALLKFASESMPPSQLIFSRGLFSLMFLLTFAATVRQRLRPKAMLDGKVLLRAGFDLLTCALYVIAIPHVAISNATAIMMSAPFIIILVAIFIFKEHVTPLKWLGVIAGFTGVLLVVQPAGDAFNQLSLVIFASAACSACRDLITRWLDKAIPSLTLTLTNVILSILMGACWGLFEPWHPLDARQFAVLAGAGIAVSLGFILMTHAMRSAMVGMLAPLRYSSLLFAALTGYLVWHSLPDSIALGGMGLIVVSGLLTQSRTKSTFR